MTNAKKTSHPSRADRADDIARVFEAQQVDIPADIRRTILAEADKRTGQADAATRTRPRSDKNPRGFDRTHGFAIAASVILAVAVGPQLLRAPDSSLTAERLTPVSDTQAPAPRTSADSTDATGVLDAQTPAETDAAMPPMHESRQADMAGTVSRSATVSTPTTTIQAATQEALEMKKSIEQNDFLSNSASGNRRSAKTSGNAPSDAASTPPAMEGPGKPAYRLTAASWMNEIRIMLVDGDVEEAREEYRLFALQHPLQATTFKPDFGRLPADEAPTEGTRALD